MQKSKRVRPTIDTKGVGKKRYSTYRSAMSKYNSALKDGYYIECVALLDSIICDRLESLSNQIYNQSKSSYSATGWVIKDLENVNDKLNDEIRAILAEIKLWVSLRNNSVHEMAKLDPNAEYSFEDRYAKLKEVSKQGKSLFNKINNAIRKYRSEIKM